MPRGRCSRALPRASSARRGSRGSPGSRTRSPSTWAAPRPTSARSSAARRRARASGSSAASRSACRRSTCTRSARAAARSSWRDAGGALRVGPQSAGAEPGPACYGRGGELPTVTDANLLLGRLPDRLAGGLELDRAAAERALASVGADPEDVIAVVNAEMLAALRVVSVERGLDPRDFALVAFGGAGALHACALAEELEIRTVLVPEAAGVLSALGLALSDERRDTVRSLVVPLGRRRAARRGRGRRPLRRPVVRADGPARRRRRRGVPPSARGALRLRRPEPAARARRAADGPRAARSRVHAHPGVDPSRRNGAWSSSTARRRWIPPGWQGDWRDGSLVVTRA